MIDQWQYTIPANTKEVDLKTETCKITKGTLTGILVYFPYGCRHLARCRILLGEKPIVPRSGKGYLCGEGQMVGSRTLEESIDEDLPELNWKLWNLDEDNDHELTLFAEWTNQPPMSKQVRILSYAISKLLRFPLE